MVSSKKFLGLSMLGVFVLGCSAEQVRKVTYPPDFKYIEKQDLSKAMWKFALIITNLNDILDQRDAAAEIQSKEVVAELNKLVAIAEGIRGSGHTTNHPLIDEHMDQFIDDLVRARLAADKHPPNYFRAGRVAGACQYCHGTFSPAKN